MQAFDGSKLRDLRRQAGISGERFSVAIGRSLSQLAHYETGRSAPPANVLCACADVLGVDVAALLSDEELFNASDEQVPA